MMWVARQCIYYWCGMVRPNHIVWKMKPASDCVWRNTVEAGINEQFSHIDVALVSPYIRAQQTLDALRTQVMTNRVITLVISFLLAIRQLFTIMWMHSCWKSTRKVFCWFVICQLWVFWRIIFVSLNTVRCLWHQQSCILIMKLTKSRCENRKLSHA